MSVTVGLVGLGYWGPNLARNLQRSPNADLKWLCDLSTDLHDKHRAGFPKVQFTTQLDDLLQDDDLDAIVIASPVPTHHKLGMLALEAGKHAFIEKPLALTARDAKELVDTAEAKDLRLMVGHLLEYHPAVLRMRDMIESGELGDVLYALLGGTPGEVYNIGGGNERTNMWITQQILEQTGADESLITYVEDRLGHDVRYSLDTSKAQRELGWKPEIAFDQGLADTVSWYRCLLYTSPSPRD